MRPNKTARFMSFVTAIALALAFAQPGLAEYTVIDMLPLDAMISDAKAVNSSGQVVGYAWGQNPDGTIYSCGFLWQNGQSTNLFAQYPEIQDGSAVDINDQGQVIGYGYLNGGGNGFVWQDGLLSLLDPLPGDYETDPVAINNAGQVIGYSVQDPYAVRYHACLWKNGAPTDLSASGMEYVLAINDSGRVIGQTAGSAACLWQGGALTLLDPSRVLSDSLPTAINASGQVVGCGRVPGAPSRTHAFIWLPQPACGLPAGLTDIGAQIDARLNPANDPSLTVSSIAWCISGAGRVFGEVTIVSRDQSGNEARSMQLWAWENGSLTDMLPIPATGTTKIVGNSSGLVVGGYMTAQSESFAFSWSRETGFETVPCLENGTNASLADVNDAGQIVGTCEAPVSLWGSTYNMSHAFMAAKVAVVKSVLPVSEATIVRHGRTCQVRVKISNPGAAVVDNVTITSVKLGDAAPLTSLPILVGTINPGASKQCTLQFKNIPAGAATLQIEGACSLGNISTTQQITAP